jgi:DNA-binding PadR family transcriptional regulator
LGILTEGKKYGYEIYKTIFLKSNRKYAIKEPTLYSSYKRLEDDGLIIGEWGDPDMGARRRYYSITEKGRERYLKNKADWEYAKGIIDLLI